MTSYPETLTVRKQPRSGYEVGEKVDQDGIFYYKDILNFFFESPKCDTYQKSYWWLLTKQEITLVSGRNTATTSISQLHPVQTTWLYTLVSGVEQVKIYAEMFA
jgi:hypothetical protein